MSAATVIANAFGEEANLYSTVLCVSPTATTAQLRKAYYKRALQYHPDKQDASKSTQDELEDAKCKFHAISVAYDILSDPERRKEYDESGELHEEDDDVGSSNKSGTDQWKEYFTGMFGKVTTDDIDEFGSKYKGSEEERKDVLKYYTMFKGDLDKMLECVMLSEEDDKQRWVTEYINPAIKKGDVEEHDVALRKTLGDGSDDSHDDDEDSEDETTESEDDDDDDDGKKNKRGKRSTSGKKKKDTKPKKESSKKNAKNNSKSKITAASAAAAARRKKKQEKEAAEAEDLIAKIRGNAVARRQRGFADMMSGLEERYAGGSDGGKGRGSKKGKGSKRQRQDDVDDIPDDEFERIRADLEAKRKSKKAKTKK